MFVRPRRLNIGMTTSESSSSVSSSSLILSNSGGLLALSKTVLVPTHLTSMLHAPSASLLASSFEQPRLLSISHTLLRRSCSVNGHGTPSSVAHLLASTT